MPDHTARYRLVYTGWLFIEEQVKIIGEECDQKLNTLRSQPCQAQRPASLSFHLQQKAFPQSSQFQAKSSQLAGVEPLLNFLLTVTLIVRGWPILQLIINHPDCQRLANTVAYTYIIRIVRQWSVLQLVINHPDSQTVANTVAYHKSPWLSEVGQYCSLSYITLVVRGWPILQLIIHHPDSQTVVNTVAYHKSP